MEKIEINTTPEMVENVYSKLEQNIAAYRKTVNRPLTLTEKILAGHLEETFLEKNLDSEARYVFLHPDRVALQDVTGQMVILQFMQSGLNEVSIPTTVHCDHLIQARTSASEDTKASLYENNESTYEPVLWEIPFTEFARNTTLHPWNVEQEGCFEIDTREDYQEALSRYQSHIDQYCLHR